MSRYLPHPAALVGAAGLLLGGVGGCWTCETEPIPKEAVHYRAAAGYAPGEYWEGLELDAGTDLTLVRVEDRVEIRYVRDGAPVTVVYRLRPE